MSRIGNIINEEISAIAKDKKKEIFDYRSIQENAWREPIKDAMNYQDIHFDLENNDSTGEKKSFYKKMLLRKDQEVKHKVNAELFCAGGDWEMPVMYFRIEFANQHGVLNKKHSENPEYVWDTKPSGRQFVLIPSVEEGNKLLKKDDGGYMAYQNDEMSKEEEKEARITKEDRSAAWNWLKELLDKIIEERHERLDLDE